MRETRLFDYADFATASQYPSGEISISLGGLQSREHIHGRWAGLVDSVISWRVEEGKVIILENVVSKKGLLLKLSSPLTCTPLFRAASSGGTNFIEVLISCFSGRDGCTLVRLRASVPGLNDEAQPSFEEVSRCVHSAAWISCVTEVGGDVVVGCADGRCARILFPPEGPEGIKLKPFAAKPPSGESAQQHGENTSMVSGATEESGPSRRSAASSMSFGLMTRLFGSPRGGDAARHPMEVSSQENNYYQRFSRRAGERRGSFAPPVDKVLSIAPIEFDLKAVISLQESGRVCAYLFKGDEYQFAGDLMLPVKLSRTPVDHFLLSGSRESVIAVVTADEDPQADSLQVFNLTAKLRANGSVSLSSTQIVKREGPIDRIVSAVFTGQDVIIASDSGYVSGVLNVPGGEGPNSGFPTGTLWTALDDVDQPFGFGRALGKAIPNARDQLLCSHRFSTSTVAKALRIENPESVTRTELTSIVKSTTFEDDEENTWRRILARAEQIRKSDELGVKDMAVVDGVGVVVARQTSLFVLRELLEAEKTALPHHARLIRNEKLMSNFTTATLLSSHGVSQVLASQYSTESESASPNSQLRFMLTAAASFSAVSPDVPLTDRVVLERIVTGIPQGDEQMAFSSAISWATSAMEPGARLLSFLYASSEMELLKSAVEYSADSLPVSSMFATGLSWLAQYRTAVAEERSNDDVRTIPQSLAKLELPSALLDQAYGCLITAAEWCRSGNEISDDDIECSMSLAGLLSGAAEDKNELSQADRHQSDIVMTGDGSHLPNGPDPRLVRQHIDFWLLERSVRLLESSRAAKSAAAAALEAMSRAPDRPRHEMMRAAAFSRFLDAGELEHALTAILSRPYQGEGSAQVVAEESAALRDAVGLFVNAAADRGALKWLSECELPEPVHALCGLALERRARAAEALHVQNMVPQPNLNADGAMPEMQDIGETEQLSCEYEQLFSWHIMRGDEPSAATAALEWGERLSKEGLSTVRNIINSKSRHVSAEQQLKLLLEWARAKCEAWSYASSASQLQVNDWKYIVRSKYSLLTSSSQQGEHGTVSLSWISRRQLLALGQSRCLTEMLSEEDPENNLGQRIEYLLSRNSVLGEQREGVRWAVNMLMKYPSYDNVVLCAEMANAWAREVGDEPLIEVVQIAASVAAQKTISSFGYPELEDLLQSIVSSKGRLSRNWNLIALESSLSTSAGAVASPQWLIDAAAWGTGVFAEDAGAPERQFTGRKRGDAAGVVRTLLRNNRPVDAAKILIAGLSIHQREAPKATYVPYSAIDSTLEMLAQLAEDYPEAERYQNLLTENTKSHMARMDEAVKSRLEETVSPLIS